MAKKPANPTDDDADTPEPHPEGEDETGDGSEPETPAREPDEKGDAMRERLRRHPER